MRVLGVARLLLLWGATPLLITQGLPFLQVIGKDANTLSLNECPTLISLITHCRQSTDETVLAALPRKIWPGQDHDIKGWHHCVLLLGSCINFIKKVKQSWWKGFFQPYKSQDLWIVLDAIIITDDHRHRRRRLQQPRQPWNEPLFSNNLFRQLDAQFLSPLSTSWDQIKRARLPPCTFLPWVRLAISSPPFTTRNNYFYLIVLTIYHLHPLCRDCDRAKLKNTEASFKIVQTLNHF